MSEKNEDIELKQTQRGFALGKFTDRNGEECSIQMSSLAEEPAIWFGPSDINIQHFKAGQGWNKFELPAFTMEEHYVANNRMHLTQKMVRKLLPLLQRFAETGELFEYDDLPKNTSFELAKLVESGWDVRVWPQAKRIEGEWDVRICWKAKLGDKTVQHEKWEGFHTAADAILDMVAVLMKENEKRDEIEKD